MTTTEPPAKIRLEPLGDRVVVLPVQDAAKTTVGGLVIPDAAIEAPISGTVLAVGPGRVTEAGTLIPLTLEVGQRVVYGKYAGTPFTIDNMQLIVLSEADLLAVLRT